VNTFKKNFGVVVVAATLSLLLAACDSGERAAEEVEEGVFDPMVGTIDRAESVEGINQQHMDRLREAEEAAQ